jgi:hypothetical protein
MPPDDTSTLPYYSQPGVMTSPGRYAVRFDTLPRDVVGLAAVAQGLVIHEHFAAAYGVTLSDEDRACEDDRLRVPPKVHNYLRGCDETL